MQSVPETKLQTLLVFSWSVDVSQYYDLLYTHIWLLFSSQSWHLIWFQKRFYLSRIASHRVPPVKQVRIKMTVICSLKHTDTFSRKSLKIWSHKMSYECPQNISTMRKSGSEVQAATQSSAIWEGEKVKQHSSQFHFVKCWCFSCWYCSCYMFYHPPQWASPTARGKNELVIAGCTSSAILREIRATEALIVSSTICKVSEWKFGNYPHSILSVALLVLREAQDCRYWCNAVKNGLQDTSVPERKTNSAL